MLSRSYQPHKLFIEPYSIRRAYRVILTLCRIFLRTGICNTFSAILY